MGALNEPPFLSIIDISLVEWATRRVWEGNWRRGSSTGDWELRFRKRKAEEDYYYYFLWHSGRRWLTFLNWLFPVFVIRDLSLLAFLFGGLRSAEVLVWKNWQMTLEGQSLFSEKIQLTIIAYISLNKARGKFSDWQHLSKKKKEKILFEAMSTHEFTLQQLPCLWDFLLRLASGIRNPPHFRACIRR